MRLLLSSSYFCILHIRLRREAIIILCALATCAYFGSMVRCARYETSVFQRESVPAASAIPTFNLALLVVEMTANEMAAKRWANTTPEQRSRIMKDIASKPRPNAKGKKKPRKPVSPNE